MLQYYSYWLRRRRRRRRRRGGGGGGQIPQEEALMKLAFTLDVPGAATANNQPARVGKGNMEVMEKRSWIQV